MKNLFVVLGLFLFFAGCTQDTKLKNLALRHVIMDFDAQLAKLPDQAVAKQVKAQTKMDVVSLNKSSDTQATAVVKIVTVKTESPSESESREVSVNMEKGDEWAVKNAQ